MISLPGAVSRLPASYRASPPTPEPRYCRTTSSIGPWAGDPSSLQPDAPFTQPAHDAHVVAHEQHGPALARDIAHLPQALPLERHVPDGKNLIHDQDLGLQMSRDGERQTNLHAARVALHRRVEEGVHLSESTISSKRFVMSARDIPRIAPFK